MANAEKLLRALLPKAYKMEAGEIDSLLSESTTDDDGVAQVLEKDKTRVAEIAKPKPGQTFQDGYKKAKAEVLGDFEKSLREVYGIDSEATGNELIDAIITAKAKPGAKEITEDDVKKHPAYQAAEKAHKNALKQTQTEWETKYNQREAEFKKGETFGSVSTKALELRNAMNPVIPGNPKVAANLEKAYLEALKGYEYDVQDNGSRIVVMKDGKVVDDGHGHSLEFEKLVKDIAGGYYEFKQNNGGGNAGNGGTEGAGGGTGGTGGGTKPYPTGIAKPKTWDEVVTIVNNTSLKPEDRQTVLDTWNSENAGK
jgi:hypothetical protein